MASAATTATDPTPPARRWWPPSVRSQIVSTLILALIVLFIAIFDWNWFKRPVERMVQASTGREFHIDGDLDVDLGRTTVIRADGLRLANAGWAKDEPWMARVGRVEIDLRIWSLLRGRIHMPELRLQQASALLETSPTEGHGGNWTFDLPAGSGERRWRLDRLWIDAGKLRFLDRAGKTDIAVTLASREPREEHAAPPVGVEGGGTWRGSRFSLSGTAESPLALAETDTPYRIDLRADASSTHASVQGTLTNPFQFQHFDLRLVLRGRNLEHLYPLLGLAMPPTAPYAFDGQLRRDNDLWSYSGFDGKVGNSDLAGDVRINVAGARPDFHARLQSKRLDFDDLAGFVGQTPNTRDETPDRFLPDTPYDLAKLRAMDADVTWKAHRIDAPPLPLDDMDAHLKLEDGLLRLEPLNFGVAGGDVRATIRMDARNARIDTDADIALRGLELPKLMPSSELAADAVGRIGGNIDIRGQGNSIAAIFGSADGDIAIGMGRGRISNLIMELAGIDIAEALRFLVAGDRQVPVRCAFAEFDVEDGLMRSRALAFDTTDTIIVGEGSINLKDESMDLLLRPRPKDRSLLTLRSPLRVSGTFASPSFRPDLKALGLRGAVAIALANIAPPAALLATIEIGPGEDSGCGGEYAK